jgi:hypothetical protein
MINLNNMLEEAKIMKDRGTVKIRDASESLPVIPKKVKCPFGHDLQQAIDDTNFPLTNGTKFANPFADVDAMIKEYTEKVISIKRYILAKGIANMEVYIAKGTAKAKNLEEWAKNRLSDLKEEQAKFEKAHPVLQILGEDNDN